MMAAPSRRVSPSSRCPQLDDGGLGRLGGADWAASTDISRVVDSVCSDCSSYGQAHGTSSVTSSGPSSIDSVFAPWVGIASPT